MNNKLLCLLVAAVIFIAGASGQAPQGINYQAVARNASGVVFANQHIGVSFAVHDSSATGTIIYQEADTTTTNQFGLFTLVIGHGTASLGSFASINWGTGNKYLEVDYDPTGGTNYLSMGTNQLVSVPYALFAGNSASGGDYRGNGACRLTGL